MTHEVPQEANLGGEIRKQVMFPGEIFVGNWPKGPTRRYSDLISCPFTLSAQLEEWNAEKARLHTADWALNQFEASGRYQSVRYIPAISRFGKFIKGRVGIVVRPKPIS